MVNLFNRELKDLEYSDIDNLLVNKIPESLNLDYKLILPLDRDKKESKADIAKDITGLANSSGGYLIYGVAETNDGQNLPQSIQGIERKKVSQSVEDWLNQVMANGNVIPKLIYSTKIINIPEQDKVILVLEIPEGLNLDLTR